MDHRLPPLAWLASRPCGEAIRHMVARDSDRLQRECERFGMSGGDFANAGALTDAAQSIAMHACVDAVRRQGLSGEESYLSMMEEAFYARSVTAFLHSGKQVFDFHEDLARELAITDVDDVTPAEIQLPYDSAYIRFPAGVIDDGGDPIDGCIVSTDAGRRSLWICAMPRVMPGWLEGSGTAFREVVIDLTSERPFPEVLEECLARDTAHLDGTAGWETEVLNPEIARAVRVNSLEATIKATETLRRFLPLLVNGLIYVDSCRTLTVRSWQDGAPAELVAKAEGGGPGARKAEQRLVRDGWSRVTLCRLTDEERQSSQGIPGGSKRTHWRRGHWRRQAYGAGHSLRRRIRIRPMLIKRSSGDEPNGHVYQVEAAS